MRTINAVRLDGPAPPWGITAIDGFIQSALSRAEREGSALPDEFLVSFCPWGERNAAYRGLAEIADVFEPLYRLPPPGRSGPRR